MSEVNYKVEFAKKYFDDRYCQFDVLNQVDIVLFNKKQEAVLYVESKFLIANQIDIKRALAQTILTNNLLNAACALVACPDVVSE